ncbi:hypothetical protein EIN_406390 [Entamoeba invadens IP1]|uniref:Uncharacterized protein n=2 Tax=Entamoeba invadens TaxID=33085 RepID=A0A0A1U777_ENTIV|nr:hypothetical protein EIN_406390 [Entamoeba invadens IP1]ELP90175.1 hypothetical protein EIN_406390 [Entamoeba invadens IP1]BAN41887.1 hypothetical protein, conserved [Entamoeba invadens]|eukprot:XP_004256946.1 hypothetical protein EIN_406390 [Entamoeba invadens IP1]
MSFDVEEDSIPAVRGWVTKQGGGHKSWKKRWFQTTPRNPFRLDYYTNDSCTTLKGHIDMSQVTDMITTRNKDKDGSMRYGFQLVTEKRTWKLIVDGEEEGEYWRENFRKLINQVRKSKGLPPLERKKHSKHHEHKDKKEKEKAKAEPVSTPRDGFDTAPLPPQIQTTPIAAPPPPPTSQFSVAAPPPPARNSVATSAPPPPPVQQRGYATVSVQQQAPPPPPVQQRGGAFAAAPINQKVQEEEEYYDEQGEEQYPEDQQYVEGEGEEEYEDDNIGDDEIFDNDIRKCTPPEKYAVALHDYEASAETELSIQRGQKLIVFDDQDPEGWLGAETKDGTRGWVSAHFVKFI